MTLEDQIYAQALVLAGELTAEQDGLLRILSRGAKNTLATRLRFGLKPEDLRADFVAAGSLLALAALGDSDGSPERFTAGDLTVQKGGGDAAAKCLRRQAELILLPYLQDAAVFLGV